MKTRSARPLAAFAGVLVFSLLSGAASAARTWTFVELGTLGGRTSDAEAVSNSGIVAGWAELPRVGNDRTQAFLWRHGALEAIGTPVTQQAPVSRAFGVNNRGDASGVEPSGEAVVWRASGDILGLGVRGAGFDINDSGAVVGEYYTSPATRAFLYDKGVLMDLGTLGGSSATAYSLNARGVVVGRASVAGDQDAHAFVYENGTMRDLGTLGGSDSVASDVNNQGVVVGWADDAVGGIVAFIHDGVMRPLAQFEVGPSFASGINQRGQVVGQAGGVGFLWEDGQVTWLDTLPAVVAAGWTQLGPHDINDRGWIVGRGIDPDGFFRAFLLIPKG